MKIYVSKLLDFFSTDLALKILMFFSIPFSILILFPSPLAFEYKYQVGNVWLYEDVIAPFSFPIYKDERQYQEELSKVYSKVYYIFDVDTQTYKNQLNEFKEFLTNLRTYLDLRRDYKVKVGRGVNLEILTHDSVKISRVKNLLLQRLSEDEIDKIEMLSKYFDLNRLKVVGEKYLAAIYQSAGVISISRSELKRKEIVVRRGRFEEVYGQDKFYDLNECFNLAIDLVRKDFGEFGGVVDFDFDVIAKILYSFVRPNLIFNEGVTNELIEREKSKILKTIGIVRENEKIITKHEIITPETYLKLESLKRAQRERGIGVGKILKDFSLFILSASVFAIFWIYLYMYRKQIYFSNKLLSLITSLFLFEILLAFLITRIKAGGHEISYLILIPTFSMLATIIFDSRVAFWGTAVISFIIGFITGYSYDVAVSSFLAGTIAIYSVRSIGNRMQIFRSFVFIFLAYFFVVIGFSLQRNDDVSEIFVKLGFVGANALLSPIFTYGLLIFFERIFGIMTEVTLVELSDFNHPLLRELSARAPGTFHHSVAVAALAEAAAKAIGANPLLARVGSYYHDIGKILNPEFFVENRMESDKLHGFITPEQSVQIIISHVEEGQKIAKEYELPAEIIKFIPMHHGTTLVAYFYGKALKRREVQDIEESDFRYKGPKPDSKETAIVMLADSVEAAVRSLDDKRIENIERVVEAIFENRIEDGQLDESNLTLKDIEEIKRTFVQILVNLYHPRVEYPEQKALKKEGVVESKEVKTRKKVGKLKSASR